VRTIQKTIRLHPVQHRFRHSSATYRAFVGGRGSGKSFVACYDLIRRAKRGRTYLLAAPTYPMLFDSEFRTFLGIARDLGVLGEVKQSAPASIKLTTGADVLFRSADDPERLRGPNLSGVVLMEASLMHKDAYEIAIACLREAGEQGWLSAAMTPRGPSHWSHEVFASNRPDTELFRSATGANPFLPAGFAAKLYAQYGDTNWARQEIGGEFVQLEGAEFPAEWLCGDDLWFDAWPDDLILKVMALDPSKGSDGRGKDYQAHVMIGVRMEAQKYALYVDAVAEHEGVTQMCDRTVSLYRQFSQGGRPVDSVMVEENATMGLFPPALEAACARAGVLMPWMCRTNSDNKEFRIRYHVAPPLSRRQIRFRRTPGGRQLVGQAQSFPFSEFDDSLDALSTGLRRVAEMLPG
jgi:phage terminase large subunit-like protein